MWNVNEIAGRISDGKLIQVSALLRCDDFEVLAKASAMKFNSPYLKEMMAIYSRGEFPH